MKITPKKILNDLREWARIEQSLKGDSARFYAFKEVEKWASGFAKRNKINLNPPAQPPTNHLETDGRGASEDVSAAAVDLLAVKGWSP